MRHGELLAGFGVVSRAIESETFPLVEASLFPSAGDSDRVIDRGGARFGVGDQGERRDVDRQCADFSGVGIRVMGGAAEGCRVAPNTATVGNHHHQLDMVTINEVAEVDGDCFALAMVGERVEEFATGAEGQGDFELGSESGNFRESADFLGKNLPKLRFMFDVMEVTAPGFGQAREQDLVEANADSHGRGADTTLPESGGVVSELIGVGDAHVGLAISEEEGALKAGISGGWHVFGELLAANEPAFREVRTPPSLQSTESIANGGADDAAQGSEWLKDVDFVVEDDQGYAIVGIQVRDGFDHRRLNEVDFATAHGAGAVEDESDIDWGTLAGQRSGRSMRRDREHEGGIVARSGEDRAFPVGLDRECC